MGELLNGTPIKRLNEQSDKGRNLYKLIVKHNQLNENKLQGDNTLKNYLNVIKKNDLKKVILWQKEKYPDAVINKLGKVGK